MLDLTRPEDAHIDKRLRNEPMIWLSSVRPDGGPHLVPVWFLWNGESILIFSQPNKQKLRNLQHNPNVVLALDTADQGGDIVILEGRAELLKEPTTAVLPAAYAEKYQGLITSYGWTPESLAKDYSQPIRITPTRFFR